MKENNYQKKNNEQDVSPEEVIAHGIMQVDGTYRYKGKLYDENGYLIKTEGNKDVIEKRKIEEIQKEDLTEDKNEKENEKGKEEERENKRENEKEEADKIKNQEKEESKQQNVHPKPVENKTIDEKSTHPVQRVAPPVQKEEKDIFTEYPREKIRSLIKQLPQEVYDALSSDKEVDEVDDICKRYGITDKFMEIQKMILYVALGLRSMEDFRKYIRDKVAKNEEDAGKIYREIFRFVFFPIKDLIGVKYITEERGEGGKQESAQIGKVREQKNSEETAKPKQDKYREPIE